MKGIAWFASCFLLFTTYSSRMSFSYLYTWKWERVRINVSSLTQTIAWMWDQTPASVSPPLRACPVLLTLLFPPSSSFILLSFVWVYIFFSAGQVLLSAFSWCSTCTSVSEGVFLLYLWREMYSTSTYSSAIFFSPNRRDWIFLMQTIIAFLQARIAKLNAC